MLATIAALAVELTDENGVPGVWLGYLTGAAVLWLGYAVLKGPNPNHTKAKRQGIGAGYLALGLAAVIAVVALAPGYADKAREANNAPSDPPAVAAP